MTAAEPAARRPSARVGHRSFAIGLSAVVAISAILVGIHIVDPAPVPSEAAAGTIQVVAAENFWGRLVAQLGGSHVHVLSIVSDPNADPHEYEANTTDALAIAHAQLAIVNGAGYDDWCLQLVSASGAAGPVVLNVGERLGLSPGDNPHFWYGAAYVNATVAAMYADLVQLAPGDASYFQAQYAGLNASLAPVWGREAEIRAHFGGAPVAATESLFQYLANSTGLNLISPYAFMSAVADGNDPPAASVTQFQDQIEGGQADLLVYNEQTVTPLTSQMQALAAQYHVPIVAVTETIQPPDTPFATWLGAELIALENALSQKALGR